MLKKRTLALLLSLAMLLTFMPAMAFAEDAADDAEQPVAAEELAAPGEEDALVEETAPVEESAPTEEAAPAEGAEEEALEPAEAMEAAAAYPVSISYTGKTLEGYVGAWGANNLYEDGNTVTITYSDKSTKTFTYIGYDAANDREYYNFYLNGDVNAETNDNFYADGDETLHAGNNDGYLRYQYDGDNYVECKVTIVGKTDGDIKSVKYTQKQPITVDYSDRWDWTRDDKFVGDELVVEDSDGIRTYVNAFIERWDGYDFYDASRDEGADAVSFVTAPQPEAWEPGKTYDVDVYYKGVKASGTVKVKVNSVPTPVKIEFAPAGDFVASSEIGEDYLGSYCFFGEGNKFIVTWKTGDATEVKNYVCKEDEDGWVFCYTDGKSEEWFWPEIKLDKKIAKGTADYSGKAIVESEYGTTQLPISVKVSAEMYKAYAEFKTYSYTGKSIKPKVVVKYYDGSKMKKMPAKWYTCKPKKYKAIGEYSYVVKIKKKYQAKYGPALMGYWDILPKTPVIKKVTAGTGSVTVTWTKFSKKLQKSIDGFYIRVSDDKNFNYWSEEIGAKPGDSKVTITGLEKGKQYYVGVFSYKSLKGDGSPWESKPSKIKPFKVK